MHQWSEFLISPLAEDPTCTSPFGSEEIGDQWYQIFTSNVTLETQDAADIVLLIDDSGSMNREHEWLLIMIPLLEQILIDAGNSFHLLLFLPSPILHTLSLSLSLRADLPHCFLSPQGVGDGAVRNRYCPIAFGGFAEQEQAHFLPVDGQLCFPVADFPRARAQLKNEGLREDGYQAIRFALDNVPFRENPFIAKNMILITDEGRTVIPPGETETRESIQVSWTASRELAAVYGIRQFSPFQAALLANDILLNVVVWADYELESSSSDVIIGVDSTLTSYVLGPNGTFTTSTDTVMLTQVRWHHPLSPSLLSGSFLTRTG